MLSLVPIRSIDKPLSKLSWRFMSAHVPAHCLSSWAKNKHQSRICITDMSIYIEWEFTKPTGPNPQLKKIWSKVVHFFFAHVCGFLRTFSGFLRTFCTTPLAPNSAKRTEQAPNQAPNQHRIGTPNCHPTRPYSAYCIAQSFVGQKKLRFPRVHGESWPCFQPTSLGSPCGHPCTGNQTPVPCKHRAKGLWTLALERVLYHWPLSTTSLWSCTQSPKASNSASLWLTCLKHWWGTSSFSSHNFNSCFPKAGG